MDFPGRIQTALVADEAYATLAACHLASLVASAAAGTVLDVHLVDTGLAPATREQLAQLLPPPHRLRISDDPSRTAAADRAAAWPEEPHYKRLLLPSLDAGGSLLLYFDVDTIVLRDLTRLWQTALGPHPVGACVDSLETAGRAIPNCDELQIPRSAPYFNSGVMLIDGSAWQAFGVTEKVLAVCRRNAAHLLAEGRWPQHDQYGLNVALAARWRPLAAHWNHFSFLPPTQDTAVIHYLGNSKPWNPACDPACRAHFLRVLQGLPRPFLENLRPAGLAALLR